MTETVKILTPKLGRPYVNRKSDCHPDRSHYAKGQCKPCYTRPFRRAYNKAHKFDARLKRLGLNKLQLHNLYKKAAGTCMFCRLEGQLLKPWRFHKKARVVALICWCCRRDSWIMGGLISRRGVGWLERMLKAAARSEPAVKPGHLQPIDDD